MLGQIVFKINLYDQFFIIKDVDRVSFAYVNTPFVLVNRLIISLT